MKILMVNRDLGVKQYHMAQAFKSLGHEVHFMYVRFNGFNLRRLLSNVKRFNAFSYLRNNLFPFHMRINRKDPFSPFSSITPFSRKRTKRMTVDVVYFSSNVLYGRDISSLSGMGTILVIDIEDSVIMKKDFAPEALEKFLDEEVSFVSKSHVTLFGSKTEKEMMNKEVSLRKELVSQLMTLYPCVSSGTIPPVVEKKTEKFSAVYCGSIFTGRGYRGKLLIEDMKKIKDIPVDIFMFNNSSQYRSVSKEFSDCENIRIHKCITYYKLKQVISKYHVGLVFNYPQFMKTVATFGMKPLEYAYAGVQPVSVIGGAIKNDRGVFKGKEFGYMSSPDKIKEDFVYNLKDFSYNSYLMEYEIKELEELLNELVEALS